MNLDQIYGHPKEWIIFWADWLKLIGEFTLNLTQNLITILTINCIQTTFHTRISPMKTSLLGYFHWRLTEIYILLKIQLFRSHRPCCQYCKDQSIHQPRTQLLGWMITGLCRFKFKINQEIWANGLSDPWNAKLQSVSKKFSTLYINTIFWKF